MSVITGMTRGGEEWTPTFVTSLEQSKCIGCGRCFKVCPRDVFELVEREISDDDDEFDDYDDGFDDDTSMVMSLLNPLDCIGCQACGSVCSKSCLSHAASEVVA